MSTWPWDQGSQGLLWWRECGAEGKGSEPGSLLPAAWAARAGVRSKPPPCLPQQAPPPWPVPLLEEVAVKAELLWGLVWVGGCVPIHESRDLFWLWPWSSHRSLRESFGCG